MPVYNAGDFLVEAIESVINQTYSNFELIIVNDNSKDNSLSIIKKFKKQYPKKIRLINLKTNLNVGGDAAVNLAIKKAKGKYIAKIDADDIAHPKRLVKQVDYLESHSDIFLVGTNAYVINKEGKIVGEKKEPETAKEIYNEYIYFHPIIHPSVMFRNFKKRSNFYRIKYPIANDYYTFFRLICTGYHFANLSDKLLYYRIYGGNTSLRNIKKGLLINLLIKLEMIKKYHYPLTSKAIVKNLIYLISGMLLPQGITYYLYLISKGIITKDDIAVSIQTRINSFKTWLSNLGFSPAIKRIFGAIMKL